MQRPDGRRRRRGKEEADQRLHRLSTPDWRQSFSRRCARRGGRPRLPQQPRPTVPPRQASVRRHDRRRHAPPVAARGAPTSSRRLAARRRADILAEGGRRGPGPLIEAAWETPAPRPIAERLAAPGLHSIAVYKASSSPSAAGSPQEARTSWPAPGAYRGRRRRRDLGPLRAALVRRIGRRPAGGPGGGSRPGPRLGLRGRGDPAADAPRGRRRPRSCCSRSSMPAKRLARPRGRALEIGLEPLVEVHDDRELARPLATGARLIGAQQPRPAHARSRRRAGGPAPRPRPRRPAGHRRVGRPRRRSTVARWRALGFDGALVGEALVRAADPGRRCPRFVAAGAAPTIRPTSRAGRVVKICGVTDADGRPGRGRAPAPTRSGSTSSRARPASWPRGGRRPCPHRPDCAAATTVAGRRRDHRRRDARIAWPRSSRAIDPGRRPAQRRRDRSRRAAAIGRRTWKVLHAAGDRAGDVAADAGASSRGSRATSPRGSTRIMLDAAGGPHPGGTGHAGLEAPRRRGRARAADRPRGRTRTRPMSRAPCGPCPPSASTSPRASSGRASPGERPTKDPLRVALFAKRARAARDDRPNIAVRADARPSPACSTPTAPGDGASSATSAVATCRRP